MSAKSDDPELKLEVDLMTLDYILCKAIRAIVEDRISQRNGQQPLSKHIDRKGESILGIFDAFMQLFRYNHPNKINDNDAYNLPRDLKIKLRILTVTNLLCRRYRASSNPSVFLPSEETLHAHRECNKARAERWLDRNRDRRISCGTAKEPTPPDKSFLERNRRDMSLHIGISHHHDKTPPVGPTVTLLDILPECMDLCRMVFYDIPDKSWMELLVQFMLHAAIEEFLIRGKPIAEAANEAFAWNYPDDVEVEEANDDQDDKTHAADNISQWETMRDSAKESFFDTRGVQDWESRIGGILDKYPFILFEERILKWLIQLLELQDSSILMQLEEGKLEGLTVEETEEFMNKVGVR
ncbi:hypothetical protein PABG_05595 [Paracoccidioides brasiliensis Pb03]|nr:hypothetical protein PABG_05595 [Paracoccidioides brasiliensis Pb03]